MPAAAAAVARPRLARRRALPRPTRVVATRTAGGTHDRRHPAPAVAPPEPWDFPLGERRTTCPTACGCSPTTCRASTSSRCASACRSPLRASPATARASRRSWRAPSTRAPSGTSAEEFARLLERKGVELRGGDVRGRDSRSTSTSSRATSSRPWTCCARSSPSRPSPRPRWLGRCKHPARRDRPGAAVAAARAGLEFVAHVLRPPTTARSRPTAGTRETVAAITRDDVGGVPRPSTSSPAGRRWSWPATSTDVDVPAARRGRPRRLGGAEGRERARRARSPRAPRPTGRRIVLVDRPGSVQTEIMVGDARSGSARSTAAGRRTRCWGSCSAGRPTPASTRCCARRRATPTASGRRSGRGAAGDCSSPSG